MTRALGKHCTHARGGRAHCDHGMRAGRFDPGPHPGGPGPLGGGHRSGPGRLPQAGLHVQGQEDHWHRVRPECAERGWHRARGRVRGGEQRRQLQRDRRPGRPGVVRREAGRGAHLRPAAGRGLPAARNPARGARPVARRPDAAPAAARGCRAAVAGSHWRRGAGRGGLLGGLGGREDLRPGGGRPGPAGVLVPARRSGAARSGHRLAGGRRAARDRSGRGSGTDLGRAVRAGARGQGQGRPLMRVAIAGAGAVGRSIAAELLDNGHEVLLIDKNPRSIAVDSVPRAEWLLADACEIASLDEASLERCNVVIAATGDDKANLVVSLLAKTEYGVPRVVARINHPNNEWLFNESWGVDVAVSTPRIMSALVEEAVSVGDLVRLMTFRQSDASLVELTMPDDAPLAGQRIGDINWPADTALVAILRDGRVIVPAKDDPLETGDELLFVTSEDVEDELATLLSGGHHHGA